TPNFSWGFFSFHLRTATGSFLRFQNGSGPAPPLAARVAARDRSRIGKPDYPAPRLKLKNPQLKLGVLLEFSLSLAVWWVSQAHSGEVLTDGI
ncbi:MAG TPA: hypothetical protein VFF31_31005, partial [Blastocatellia bacterium]|nr:hypothetical protein [Blastocatellia bacterium]